MGTGISLGLFTLSHFDTPERLPAGMLGGLCF